MWHFDVLECQCVLSFNIYNSAKMEVQDLLSRAGQLPALDQRRVAAIIGSLVADAAGKATSYISAASIARPL